MPEPDPDPEKPTELGISAGDRNWAIAIFATIGVIAGAALPLVWKLIEDADWVPMHGVFEALLSMSFPAVAVLRPVALGLVGAGIALVWALNQPRLHVSRSEIEVAQHGQTRVIPRGKVDGIYLRKNVVVIESADGRRLFEEEIEGAKQRAGAIFRDHGWPFETK